MLTSEQRERLEASLRWHFAAHADQPDATYASLGVSNALLIVERLLAEQREGIAAAIRDERRAVSICPIHERHDCSPLLNGCSVPIRLHAGREVDARIAETYGGAQ